jgi:hypothetical protein
MDAKWLQHIIEIQLLSVKLTQHLFGDHDEVGMANCDSFRQKIQGDLSER